MEEGFQGGALPTECSADGDCPASLVCYDASLSWTRNQSWCLCSTWYGWELDSPANSSTTCSLGASTITSIVIFSICTAVLLFRLVVVCITLERLRTSKRLKRNASFALAIVYCIGWLISGILRLIFDALEFGYPEEQTLMPFGPEWKYSSYGIYQSKPLFAASTIFGMLVDYQLIVVWFSVALTANSRTKRQPSRAITALKALVLLFEVVYIVCSSILVGRDQISPFLYFSVGFLALALIGYMVAGRMLFALLSDALDKQQSSFGALPNPYMVTIARNIKYTSIANGILIVLSIVCLVGLAKTNGDFKEYGNYVPAGFHTAQIVVMTLQLCVVTHYLYISSAHRKDSDQISSKAASPDRTAGNKQQQQPAAGDKTVEPVVRTVHKAVREMDVNELPSPKNFGKGDAFATTAGVVIDHYDPPVQNTSTSSNQPPSNSTGKEGINGTSLNVTTKGALDSSAMSPTGSPLVGRKQFAHSDLHSSPNLQSRRQPAPAHVQQAQDDDLLLEYYEANRGESGQEQFNTPKTGATANDAR